MKTRLAPILIVALAVAGGATARAHAQDPQPAAPPPVLAMSVDNVDGAGVPPGMTVVFAPPAGDGFSDGGDGPGGLEWVRPDGFSDGGDVPNGFIAALGRPAGLNFWLTDDVPDGLIAVLARIPPDGFSDGGDVPDGFIPVLFPAIDSQSVGDGG
jgi:hypothetical protein